MNISSTDLEYLRSESQQSKILLNWFKREESYVFVGVLTSFAETGNEEISASGTFYSGMSLREGQEIWFGNGIQTNDIGIGRIKSIVSTTVDSFDIIIARNSFQLSPGCDITVINNFPFKPRYTFIGEDGTFYKDSDIVYDGQNSGYPITIAGPSVRAGVIDPSIGNIRFKLFLEESYSVDSGLQSDVTVSVEECLPSTGFSYVLNGDKTGYVQFTSPGQFWVRFRSTNTPTSKTQDTWRLFLVQSQEQHLSLYKEISSVSYLDSFNTGGKTVKIEFFTDVTLGSVDDFSLVCVWRQDNFGEDGTTISLIDTEHNPTNDYLSSGDEIIISGYIHKDLIVVNTSSLTQKITFTIQTIEAIVKERFSYSLVIQSSQENDRWYKYPGSLNTRSALWWLFKWHSTLLEIHDIDLHCARADVIFPVAEFEDGSIMEIGTKFTETSGISAKLVTHKSGRLFLCSDLQLRDLDSIEEKGVVFDIDYQDIKGVVGFDRELEYATCYVHLSGFFWDGTYDEEGQYNAQPVCAVAPGDEPLDFGKGLESVQRQILESQTEARELAGRFLAKINNHLPSITIQFRNYLPVLDCATRFTFGRGFDLPRELSGYDYLIIRSVSASLNSHLGFIECDVVFEPYSYGPDGTNTDCPTVPEEDGPPESFELPGGIITSYEIPYAVEYLPQTSPTWVNRGNDETFFMCQDIFNSILYRGLLGEIRKSVDAGQNWTSLTLPTPPNDAGDDPSPDVEDLEFVFGSCSRVNEGTVVWLARYYNGSNYRSWIYRSYDFGITWDVESVSVGEGVGGCVWDNQSTSTTSKFTSTSTYPHSARMGENYIYGFDDEPYGTTGSGNFKVVVIDANCDLVFEQELLVNVVSEVRSVGIVGISDTILALLYNFQIGVGTRTVSIRYYEIIDNEFVIIDTPINLLTGGTQYNSTSTICRVDDTTSLICISDFQDEVGVYIKIYVVQLDSGSLSIIDTFDKFIGYDDLGADDIYDMVLYPIDLINFVFHCYFNVVQSDDLVFDIGGLEIKLQPTYIFDYVDYNFIEGNFDLGTTSDRLFYAAQTNEGTSIICFASYSGSGSIDDIKAVHVNMISSSVSVGIVQQIDTASLPNRVTACKRDSNSIWIAYCDQVLDHTIYRTLTIDGSDLIAGDPQILDEYLGTLDAVLTDGAAIGYIVRQHLSPSPQVTFLRHLILNDGSYNIFGLGIDIDSSDSSTLFLTGHDETSSVLRYFLIDTDLLTNILITSFGSATITEVIDRDKVIFPKTFDLFGIGVFLYGKTAMSGNDYNLFVSEDSEVFYPIIEDLVGHIGALDVNFDEVFFVLCTDTSSHLYVGTYGSLDISYLLANELPYFLSTNPNSMKYSYPDDAIWSSASNASDHCVVYLIRPFTSFVNRTNNHQADGVNSLEVL